MTKSNSSVILDITVSIVKASDGTADFVVAVRKTSFVSEQSVVL